MDPHKEPRFIPTHTPTLPHSPLLGLVQAEEQNHIRDRSRERERAEEVARIIPKITLNPKSSWTLNSKDCTWTPKVCKNNGLMVIIKGLGLLFCILLGFG